MPAAIECQNLTRRFGEFVAVDHLSFNVEPGRIFGFLGPNGSGKSTTIRMLCGLLAPSEGLARVGGIDVRRDPDGVKKRIGYMSQRFSLYDDLSVRENLEFFGGMYGLRGGLRRQRIATVLEQMDLENEEAALARELSAGVRQRLALGTALLHEPPILFLDEPTSGVDPLARRRFWDLIYNLASGGVTVLVTTHYMDEAEHCNEIVLIRQGKLVGKGSPSDLKRELLPGPVLELTCSRPREAAVALRGLPDVHEAILVGARIRLLMAGLKDAVPAILACLDARGIGVHTLTPADPALEDVFVAVAEDEP